FESDDPYPLRDGGAKAMLQTFERETEKRRKAYLRGQLHSDNDEPDAHKGKSGKETEDRDEDSWPDTDSPPLKRGVVVESVEVEPVPIHKWREPWYVEDHTTFRVYDYPTAQLRSGRLDVRTWPDGARVYLDGRYVGITPLSLENLREGRYHLKLTKRGYENVSQEIIIQRTRSTVVREHLSPERGRPLRPDRGDDDGGWNGRLDIDLSW
ncbi:PEGA domain-containing protein, partial [Candidatus Sumerlaeota bacterium]|nr:PEGA domain-containing protein [Candidatus Sumerlaeota bacterium]